MRKLYLKALAITVGLIAIPVASARADCTNPASPVGGISYGSAGDLSTLMACDGSDL